MRLENSIRDLAASIYGAIHLHLPNIKYEHLTPQERREGKEPQIKERRPYESEIEVYMFPQTWGSTTLGFGGIGGQAITTAYTTVVVCQENNSASIFFAGRHAYTVPVTSTLMKDILTHSIVECSKSNKYNEG